MHDSITTNQSPIPTQPEQSTSIPPRPRSAFEHLFSNQDESRTALIDAFTNQSFTVGQVKDKSLRLAWTIRNGLGSNVKSEAGSPTQNRGLDLGDHVLLFASNHILYPAVLYAAFAAGTPIALALGTQAANGSDIAHCMRLIKPQLIVVGVNQAQTFVEVVKLLHGEPEFFGLAEDLPSRVIILSDDNSDSLSLPRELQDCKTVGESILHSNIFEPENLDNEKSSLNAVYIFTSGTTGVPKAVQVSHSDISLRKVLKPPPKADKSPSIVLSPHFMGHASGFLSLCNSAMVTQSTVVLFSSYTFNSFVDAITKYNPHSIFCSPPMLAALGQDPYVLTHLQAPRLHTINFAGCALPAVFLDASYTRLRSENIAPNVEFKQIYGMSELVGAVSIVPTGRTDKRHTVGFPCAGVKISIRDLDTDEQLSQGCEGEIWVAGRTVTKGYLGDPVASRALLSPDGKWFRTGDVGLIDEDGFIVITDRLKEMVTESGIRVSPAALEAILVEHPDIADAAVFRAPSSDKLTETRKACVVPKDLSILNDQESDAGVQRIAVMKESILEWFRKETPRTLSGGVILVDSIPRNISGKILRRVLAERYYG